MNASEFQRAVAAATSIAAALGLTVDDAIVLQDSNRVVLRLMPCDVVARVAPMAYHASAELEVEIARRLTEIDSPVVAPEPRVEPRVYVHDGFAINMWTYFEPLSPQVSPADYVDVQRAAGRPLQRLSVRRGHQLCDQGARKRI